MEHPHALVPLLPCIIFLGDKPPTMPSPLYLIMLRHLFVKYITDFPNCHAMVHVAAGPTTMVPTVTPDHHADTVVHNFNGDPHQEFTMFTPIHTMLFTSAHELYAFLALFPDTKKDFYTPHALLYKII